MTGFTSEESDNNLASIARNHATQTTTLHNRKQNKPRFLKVQAVKRGGATLLLLPLSCIYIKRKRSKHLYYNYNKY